MNLSATEVIAAASMVVALVGGIPGVLRLIRDRSKFSFLLTGMMTGRTPANEAMLLLAGVMSNSGEKSFSPIVYSLLAEKKDRWIRLRPVEIPANVVFGSHHQKIDVLDPQRVDLCRWRGTIAPGGIAEGLLMFTTPDFTDDELRMARLCLECTDSLKKKHEVFLDPKIDIGDGQSSAYTLPTIGIRIAQIDGTPTAPKPSVR